LNRTTIAAVDLGAFAGGMLDVLFAFSLALERKGLLTRAEIADTLRQVKSQVEAQEGAGTKRAAVAELMLQAFDMPVAGDQARARLEVVEGGKGPD
jgi:hypothetical protein